MRRILGWSLVLSLIVPICVQGQSTELEKVQFYVGEWTYEHSSGHGTMVFKSFGDNLIYAEEEYTTDSGNLSLMLHVMGYDGEEGVYWWRRFTRSSGGGFFKGTIEGNTLTWVAEAVEGRQTRMVQEKDSDDLFHFRWERSVDGGPWEATIEGTTRRVR